MTPVGLMRSVYRLSPLTEILFPPLHINMSKYMLFKAQRYISEMCQFCMYFVSVGIFMHPYGYL